MTPVRRVIYLHGFASSPDSSKAGFFARECAARGIVYDCPDLNEPSFELLTVTRMIGQVAALVADGGAGPVALVGSSLGAFVALHAAAADRTGLIDRLILLAPAFDFGGNRLTHLGPHSVDEWRRAGHITVFHYAYGQPRDVSFALYEDAAAYDAFAVDLAMPILVVQGRQDDVVDAAMVERWASPRPSAILHLVDDGHQLQHSMPLIWRESARLLGLAR